jgi:hypothetical protein
VLSQPQSTRPVLRLTGFQLSTNIHLQLNEDADHAVHKTLKQNLEALVSVLSCDAGTCLTYEVLGNDRQSHPRDLLEHGSTVIDKYFLTLSLPLQVSLN